MATAETFTILEIALPIGYLIFSMWTAYTSGYNMAMMRKHKPKGQASTGRISGSFSHLQA